MVQKLKTAPSVISVVAVYLLDYARQNQVTNISHNNITIQGNTITDWHGRAMWIANAKNVTASGNTFNGNATLNKYTAKETMYINYCDIVTVKDNQFNDGNMGTSWRSIVYGKDNVTNTTINDNTFGITDSKKQVVQE